MKVLIIGLGSIGLRHLNVLENLDYKFEIYALRSSRKSMKIKNVNNLYRFNEINFIPNFSIISNPTYLHEKTIIKCLSFNTPIFIEKPVLSSLINANKILKEIKDNNIITYNACNMRFYPVLQFLKQNLNKNEFKINEINIYNGSYLPQWRKNIDYKNSYSSYSKMGGGVHLDLIHEIDYCIWLFGFPKSINSIKKKKSTLSIDSVDFSRFDLEYDNFNAGITLNYYRRDPKREMEIITNDDTLIVDLLNNSIFSNIDNKYIFKKPYKIADSYKNQMIYFLKCIDENNDTFNNFKNGIEVLKIALHDE